MPLNDLTLTEEMSPAQRAEMLRGGAPFVQGLQQAGAVGAVPGILGTSMPAAGGQYPGTRTPGEDKAARALDLLFAYGGMAGTPLASKFARMPKDTTPLLRILGSR